MTTSDTLRALILGRKGDRSYEALAKACGGTPTAGRLQQMATGEAKNFPDPASIRGLARGLNLPVTEIVLAAARDLSLPVGDSDPTVLRLASAGTLPEPARQALETVAREFGRLVDASRRDPRAGLGRDAPLEERRANAMNALMDLGFTPEGAAQVVHDRVTSDHDAKRDGMQTHRNDEAKGRGAS